MLGLLWFLQRRLTGRAQRNRDAEIITVLGRRGVGAKAQLVIAEAEGNRYVLGVTEHGVTVIDKLPARAASSRPVSTPVVSNAASAQVEASDAAAQFDRLFAAEAAHSRGEDRDAEASYPLRRDRPAKRMDPLNGSILSPGTWRQTAEFLRRSR